MKRHLLFFLILWSTLPGSDVPVAAQEDQSKPPVLRVNVSLVLLNVAVPRDFDWQKNKSIIKAHEAAEQTLNGRGRVLLRPSGTEPVLRIMVEAREAAAADRCARDLAEAVTKAAI